MPNHCPQADRRLDPACLELTFPCHSEAAEHSVLPIPRDKLCAEAEDLLFLVSQSQPAPDHRKYSSLAVEPPGYQFVISEAIRAHICALLS